MIGRLIWIAALIAVAAVTSFAQLDRQARYSPHFASSVPERFRAFAQAHIVAAAIDGDDDELAVAEARRLVARRPIPAEHLRLLALAQFNAGQPAATTSIQLAAQRGWRDVATQEAMLRLALGIGDNGEAARRYAALLQSKASNKDLLVELGPEIFGAAGDEGSAVFTKIIAGNVRWKGAFLNRGAQVMPADAFVQIIRASAGRGARFDCNRLRSAAMILAERDAELAQELKRDAPDLC